MRIADGELWNLLNGAIWRFRRRYMRQNPTARYLIQHLCGGRAKKTNPTSFCRMAGRETEHDEGGRRRYGSTGARFRVRRSRSNSAFTFRGSDSLLIICGKTQVSKVAPQLMCTGVPPVLESRAREANDLRCRLRSYL